MRIFALQYILIFSFTCSFGQNDSAGLISANLRIAYNSSIIYPGAFVSVDFPVRNVKLTKIEKDGNSKSIDKLRFLTFALGYYHHKGFNDNIYIMPEWVMRRSKIGPWFTEFTVGIGYSRTFLGGTTYKIDESGNVSIIPLAGYSYALVAAGYGLGYNYSKTRNIPLCLYSRFNMLTMFPYNSTIYPRPTLEVGIIYSPSHFLGRKINTIQKKKSHHQ